MLFKNEKLTCNYNILKIVNEMEGLFSDTNRVSRGGKSAHSSVDAGRWRDVRRGDGRNYVLIVSNFSVKLE